MLSPFDDFPIHQTAEPIAHSLNGDPNQYDCWFMCGHHRDGEFFFGAAMGLYPNRGVIDAAFAVVRDGVEHSIFASGRMPFDRSSTVGPIRIETPEPLQTMRWIVEPNEHGIACDLTYRAVTVAIEEPKQSHRSPQGQLASEHTRLTQMGTWEGTIVVDGDEFRVEATTTPGTKDRSWGTRPIGPQIVKNAELREAAIFWLWAPLHFGDRCTHLLAFERPDGTRFLQQALVLEPKPEGETYWGTGGIRQCRDFRFDFEWEPGRRNMGDTANLYFTDPVEGEVHIELEKFCRFQMSGIGYWHPYWGHGTNHGVLETGRESVRLADVDPAAMSAIHLQCGVKARWGDRVGVGILEQLHIGPHTPTGLTGMFDGYAG